MKTLYRCISCFRYTLNKESCPKCNSSVSHPYPARFSLVKERKFRPLLKKK
ncbi:MAG: nucleolar RNA-binding Nop10p family protein [Candidatus Kariarchaeaceae archaeon]